MPHRETWAALPPTLRHAIEAETGPVVDTTPPTFGKSSEFSAKLHTARGDWFCKGVRTSRPYAWTHRNELAVGRDLPPQIAPALLFDIEQDGWLMLGFELAPGTHADLTPASRDLLPVRDLVAEIGARLTPCPSSAKATLSERWADVPGWAELRDDRPDDLHPWACDHLDALADIDTRADLDGDTLVHFDLNPGNVLVHNGAARAIDWAWSARGPAWVDPAYLVVRLLHAGHTAEDAERWAHDIPAFAQAPNHLITAFAVRLAGAWESLARSPKARDHARQLADTAREWAEYRLA